tara:strand:- start:35 stop:1450 length:1416 start_codon:yes stop_codon:yes gene_type:complete
MFKLEKVFQNDDRAFYFYITIIKSLFIIFLYYFFSILENNTIYQLLSFNIFQNSKYYIFSIFISFFFLFSNFFLGSKKIYNKNFLSFLKEDLLNLIIANILTFAIYFILKIDFELDLSFLYSSILMLFSLMLSKLYFNYVYDRLIKQNIIQKNVMLVGTYEEISELLKNTFEPIIIFKCCIITDADNHDLRLLRSELRFPIFSLKEDIRIILEYHALGQIWMINGNKESKRDIFSKIIKYSVDTLNIKLDNSKDLKGKKLLADKYDYEFYEMSRFYGINLFLKIIIDKFLSIIFLIISFPILILSIIAIYFEDGFPIFFSQNRTGWDGRRFKIYKLRTLKKESFDKTIQVDKGDKRVLKIGRVIRRYSIDELPQFYNVFLGDMSIVGPRPHMVEHDIKYALLFENFLKRHKCNPGLTGWAQVNGLRGATPNPEIMKRRMEYDLWYLNNWSLLLDFYIILKTFYALFKYKGD